MKKIVFYGLIIFCAMTCSKKDSVADLNGTPDNNGVKILFIGNSHTNYNFGIHTHVKNFATDFNLESVTNMSAPGGFTLDDHLAYAATLDLIDAEDWDFIILQENTFRAANEPDLMLQSVLDFRDLLLNNGATVYLFKTWAYEANPEMLPLLTSAYNQARTQSGFGLVSVGSEWNNFINSNTLSLYDGDGIHPNANGTYLTAAIFFKTLFNRDDLTNSNYNSSLEQSDANTIKTFVSNL